MGAVCGVAVESDAVRISYFRDGERVEDSIDAEGAAGLLNGKLVDCGPFDDVVLTGRDTVVVESLLDSLRGGPISRARVVDEGGALLAYARSVEELAHARALLVLDLGRDGTSAFTLDVAAGEVTRSDRRTLLSGEALDDVVEQLVMTKGILPPAYGAEAEREYRDFFRELKELITTSAGVRAPGGGPMLLTREEFENAIDPTVRRTLAWAAPTEPDAVMLIGGGARIPLIRTLVEQQWTVPLVLPESPSSVILHGAALEAVPRLEVDESVAVAPVEAPERAVYTDGPTEALLADPDLEEHTDPVTDPIPVVAPTREESGAVDRGAALDTSTAFEALGAAPAEADGTRARRRIRWSVRDAAGLAGLAAIVTVVWGVIFLRGDTPPPPGIGVDPVPAGTTAVVERVPAPVEPAPPPAVVEQFPEAPPEDFGQFDESQTGGFDSFDTGDPGLGAETFGEGFVERESGFGVEN